MGGLTGVFLSAFLAATILPFFSEVVLSALYATGESTAVTLLLIATTGNVLGLLIKWTLGVYLPHWRDHKLFPFSAKQVRTSKLWFQRNGIQTLLIT